MQDPPEYETEQLVESNSSCTLKRKEMWSVRLDLYLLSLLNKASPSSNASLKIFLPSSELNEMQNSGRGRR